MDTNTPDPATAAEMVAEVQKEAAAALPPEATAEELEAREKRRQEATASLLRDARRWDNRVRWENQCPPGLQASEWDHPAMAPFKAQIERVLAYQIGAKGILASGPTGRGKSRSMWQLMRRLGENGHDLRFYTATDWFTTLQSNIRFGNDEARGWVEAVARRHVIFIDDLGQEAVQTARENWAQAWFFRFLDIRVGERLPLFVTTNLRAEEMASRAGSVRGDPLVRRLLDLCEPIPFETEKERLARESRQRKPTSTP